MDYKSVFNFTEQVVDKVMHSLTAVPFVRGHRSVFPGTPRNTGVYTRHPTFVTAGRRGHGRVAC